MIMEYRRGVGTDWAALVSSGMQMYASIQEAKAAEKAASAQKSADTLALQQAQLQQDQMAIAAYQARIDAANRVIENANAQMEEFNKQNKKANTALYITLGVTGVAVLGVLGYVIMKK